MKKTAFSPGKRLLAISVCVLLVALTACGGSPAPSPTPTAPATTAPATSAAPKPTGKVAVTPLPVKGPPVVIMGNLILAPKDGDTKFSNDIWVQLDLTNINLVNANPTNAEGYGHVIFYQDMVVPIETGKTAYPSPIPTGGKAVKTGSNIAQNLGYQWRYIPNGNHTFGAQVVQNDDTPFNPPIWAISKVNIQGQFPTGKQPVSPSPSPK